MALNRKVFFLLPIIFVLGIVYKLSNVDLNITKADIQAINQINIEKNCSNIDGFMDELQCIQAVQNAVYTHVNVGLGIEHDQSREPLQLLAEGKGLCYDRSRFIEKVLTYYNFDIRHVSIFYSKKISALAFLNKKAKSHAFLEVLTSQGWLVVDSIDPFIALDSNKNIYTAVTLRDLKNRIEFINFFGNRLPQNFYKNFSVVYGLYSRHGKFYPPYTPIPDINWKQFLMYNW